MGGASGASAATDCSCSIGKALATQVLQDDASSTRNDSMHGRATAGMTASTSRVFILGWKRTSAKALQLWAAPLLARRRSSCAPG